ncbi:MAG: GTPase [Gilvibacter sp.]
MSKQPELLFVYNADSGVFNAVKDSLHKWLKPETYSCALCSLTHSFLGETSKWKHYKKTFTGTLSFYHKDQFQTEFASKWLPKYDFPIVLIKRQEQLDIFLTSQELEAIQDVTTLIQALEERLK